MYSKTLNPVQSAIDPVKFSAAVTHHRCPRLLLYIFCISLCTWPSSTHKIWTTNDFFLSHGLALFFRNHVIFHLLFSSNINTIHTHTYVFWLYKYLYRRIWNYCLNNFNSLSTHFCLIFQQYGLGTFRRGLMNIFEDMCLTCLLTKCVF